MRCTNIYQGTLQKDNFKTQREKVIYKYIYYFMIVIVAPLWGMAQPAIVSFTPTRNALNIEKNANITVTFDRDIDQSTINNSTIKVNGSISGLHNGSFSYNNSTYTATVNPNSDFQVGEVVDVTLTRGINSADGDSIISAYSWSFVVKVNSGFGKFIVKRKDTKKLSYAIFVTDPLCAFISQ